MAIYEVVAMRVKKDSRYELDTTIAHVLVYRFYLRTEGPPPQLHGPFEETVPLANFDATEIQRRIDALTAHLSSGWR